MSKTSLRRSDSEKERYWRAVVQGQEESGQSVRAYCREAGVKESAFYWWRRELARRSGLRKAAGSRPVKGRKPGPRRSASRMAASLGDGPRGGEASGFVPVRVLGGNAPADVEIHLGDGRMICVRPGFDRQTLVEVLAALESRPC